MTYLYYKKLEQLEWASSLEAHGYMWPTPGPYLRRSMLQVLARQVSDRYLPEVFWKANDGPADMTPERTAEEEEDLALSLMIKIDATWIRMKNETAMRQMRVMVNKSNLARVC